MPVSNEPWIDYKSHLRKIEERAEKIYVTRHKIHLPILVKVFFRQVKKDSLPERAASMAFNFTLSIFPFIIFLFTIIPYIPIPQLNESIMDFLEDIMPPSMYAAASSTIYDIINIPHGGLLSFGFMFALFTATNGVRAMIATFNRCYRTAERRKFLKRTWTAFYLVFFISFTIFISVGLSLFSKIYLESLESKSLVHRELLSLYSLVVLKHVTLFVILFITISLIYFIAPTVAVRWSFFSIGSLIASALSMVFTLLFSFYIERFNSYNKIYGSIGAFIGVMVWLYAISFVLLIGFEINASIDQIKNQGTRNAVVPS